MRNQRAIQLTLGLLYLISRCLCAEPAQAQLSLRCNWGVGALTPPAQHWPGSTQVMMMPIVMDFGGLPSGTSKVAFVSFGGPLFTLAANHAGRDGGGVLRIIDGNCNEIARYPDPSSGPPPSNCPATLNTAPDLAPLSGLAAGNIDATPDVEIVAVIGGPTSNHRQIAAFTLVGANLVPKWCSPPNALPTGDAIPGGSAPAIAQLDQAGTPGAAEQEIILDNKVFNFDGTLRYTGFSHNNDCSVGVAGGSPCPRSRTVAVANVLGANTPQIFTGRGIYTSNAGLWTGTLGWVNTNMTMTSPPLIYPAVAELDSTKAGPEIVVTDTMAGTLRVLTSINGTQLASTLLPNPLGGTQCGGPPLIADAHAGSAGPEIGVASCTRYTLYRYSPGSLTVLWSSTITDPSGQTTATMYRSPAGARIVYADRDFLRVFQGANGAELQKIPNSSATGMEGPVVASLDSGPKTALLACTPGQGVVIVSANDYGFNFNKQRGVRIFNGEIGQVASCWNQYSFHVTNVTNSFGTIPTVEPLSWLTTSAAGNSYRVQR